jgi:hypothetical protein
MKKLQKKNKRARITFFKSCVACEQHYSVGAWSRTQDPRYTDWDCEGKRLDNVSIPLRNVPSKFALQLQLVGKLISGAWPGGGHSILEHRKGAGHPHIYSNREDSHLEPVPGAEAVTLKEAVSE